MKTYSNYMYMCMCMYYMYVQKQYTFLELYPSSERFLVGESAGLSLNTLELS